MGYLRLGHRPKITSSRLFRCVHSSIFLGALRGLSAARSRRARVCFPSLRERHTRQKDPPAHNRHARSPWSAFGGGYRTGERAPTEGHHSPFHRRKGERRDMLTDPPVTSWGYALKTIRRGPSSLDGLPAPKNPPAASPLDGLPPPVHPFLNWPARGGVV